MQATFMAKPYIGRAGSGMHVHMSLLDKDGRNVFADAAPQGSVALGHAMGGLAAIMHEAMAFFAPTVNAYRRLVPGLWAPTASNWGVENRTTAIRVIPAGPEGQRSEYRIAPADANPHLALAAALASGLAGIEEGLELPEPVVGSAYAAKAPEALALPGSLGEAAARLRASSLARRAFGDAFVEHYATTREAEERAFRRSVSDWDLARYFELI